MADVYLECYGVVHTGRPSIRAFRILSKAGPRWLQLLHPKRDRNPSSRERNNVHMYLLFQARRNILYRLSRHLRYQGAIFRGLEREGGRANGTRSCTQSRFSLLPRRLPAETSRSLQPHSWTASQKSRYAEVQRATCAHRPETTHVLHT